MEAWRHVWRNALEPLLSDRSLETLRAALEADDQRLIQGSTTNLPPLGQRDCPVEGACPIAYCGWLGEGLASVSETDEFFFTMSEEIAAVLGEPFAVRHFTNFWDDCKRTEAVPQLLAEVRRSIAGRNAPDVAAEEVAHVA